MDPSARTLLSIIEGMTEKNLDETANFKFMDALRDKLMSRVGPQPAAREQALNIREIEQIVSSISVNLNDRLVDDEFIDEMSTAMAVIVGKLHVTFINKAYYDPAAMVVSLSRRFSLDLE